MDSVPVRVNGSASGRHNGGEAPTPQSGKRRGFRLNKKVSTLLAGLLLLALIAGAAWLYFRTTTAAAIDGSKYQAVFFTNGQVYFGKLSTLNGGYMKLTDIYYLQAQTDTDGNEESANPQETSTQENPDVQLIKLGNEVHGPEDEMIISKEQILFFENLKAEGKVSQSINQFKQQR